MMFLEFFLVFLNFPFVFGIFFSHLGYVIWSFVIMFGKVKKKNVFLKPNNKKAEITQRMMWCFLPLYHQTKGSGSGALPHVQQTKRAMSRDTKHKATETYYEIC